MARKIKWRHDLHSMTERVRRSKTECWTRSDIEDLFNVKRASAQTIMRAIGSIDVLGTLHTVSRTSLLSYLEGMILADNLELSHRERVHNFNPAPRRKAITVSVPPEMRSVMVRDLPPEVHLGPGRVEVSGDTVVQIVERLVLLGLALQNDLGTAADIMMPPSPSSSGFNDELKALFQDLRAREIERAATAVQAKSSVCTALGS
ncbi:MAG: hypothetical protein HIU91_07955 [Acidobacteria bacterium]|nr:hypothetical protein [Acidobacteriota bacterium]